MSQGLVPRSSLRAPHYDDVLVEQFLDWCARIEMRRVQAARHTKQLGVQGPSVLAKTDETDERSSWHAAPTH